MDKLNTSSDSQTISNDEMIGFRIPTLTKEKLIKATKEKSIRDGNNYKVSDIIRFAINDYLKKEAISSQPYQDDC